MGSVYEGVHEDVEKRVAIKILHEVYARKPDITHGFRNEARASARIGAPNIVEIYDFRALPDGQLLIAMEYLEGEDLFESLKDGPLAWPRIVAIGRQICKGLAAAHEAGIVHRDLKPENVMLVRRDGRDDFVKLLDFGVARFLLDDATARGAGTPTYMAPEVISGQGDQRIDVYSFGCLLFELAVGKPPYDGTDQDVFFAHATAPIPRPSERIEAPAAFDALVARCMAKDPADRFASMHEIEAALCELQIERGWTTAWDDLPPPAVEPSRRDRIAAALAERRRRGNKRWTSWSLALGMTAALVGGAAWITVEPGVASAEAQNEDAIETLTQRAQAAAAKAYYVYPPIEDPEGATAYRHVLALEELESAAAQERATELRAEFAETLVRLGDRYWESPEGRRFANEYYMMALLFAPHPRAVERASATEISLDELRDKAEHASFSRFELAAVLPLTALAVDDVERPPAASASEVEALRRPPTRPPRSEAPRMDDALRLADPSVLSPRSSAKPSEGAVAVSQRTVGKPTLPRTPARPASARTWIRRAEQAERDGRYEEAEGLYHRALGRDPGSIEAVDGLGDLHFSRARYAQSLKFREHAVQLRPRSGARWLGLGDAYFKTLRYADALEAYEKAERLGNAAAAARIRKAREKLGR